MKAVMLSIQPKWCELIASSKKTIEVRKTAPKLETPFKCYIYCTASDVHSCLMVGGGETKLIHCCNYKTAIPVGGKIGNGKVIGEFICDNIEKLTYNFDGYGDEWHEWNDEYVNYKDMCLSEKELEDYLGTSNGYAWHIFDLKIYNEPKELYGFKRLCPFPTEDCDLLCPYALGEYHGDGINGDLEFIGCGNTLIRPPKSWCYVEELIE